MTAVDQPLCNIKVQSTVTELAIVDAELLSKTILHLSLQWFDREVRQIVFRNLWVESPASEAESDNERNASAYRLDIFAGDNPTCVLILVSFHNTILLMTSLVLSLFI